VSEWESVLVSESVQEREQAQERVPVRVRGLERVPVQVMGSAPEVAVSLRVPAVVNQWAAGQLPLDRSHRCLARNR
jgi:hypothetical protein